MAPTHRAVEHPAVARKGVWKRESITLGLVKVQNVEGLRLKSVADIEDICGLIAIQYHPLMGYYSMKKYCTDSTETLQ